MRALLSVAVVVLAGCVSAGPDAAVAPDTSVATSNAWTVVGHLDPRGALAVDFNVTTPTTCRLAFFVHQLTSGDAATDTPGHADLWIDGSEVRVPFMGTTSISGFYHSRVKAGPADTR